MSQLDDGAGQPLGARGEASAGGVAQAAGVDCVAWVDYGSLRSTTAKLEYYLFIF